MQKTIIKTEIKNLALYKYNFDGIAIAEPHIQEENIKYYKNWLANNNNAKMQYLENNIDLKFSPKKLVENTKSIIVLLNSYSSKPTKSKNIAKYALIDDYHFILKNKMQKFLDELHSKYNINGRCFTDSAPILERHLANYAGLGFIGKNTCLINQDYGSFLFISEIFIDKELEFDKNSIENKCGTCTNCIDACPTGALSPFSLNANLCISYHTIESKEEIPSNIKKSITTQLFGCDICQDVCPYNKTTNIGKEIKLNDRNFLETYDLNLLQELSNSQFKKQFKSTSLYRTGFKKLVENLDNYKTLNK